MIIRVIDFETCGLTPADGGVCEVGVCDLLDNDVGWAVCPPCSALVDPGRPIKVEASAVHHISDDDVRGAPPFSWVFPTLMAGPPDVFCAHNAKFELQWFTGGDQDWICTLNVARRLWPDCPSHSNQCLRYWLGLQLDPVLAMPPHRAGPDSYVTAHILLRALDEASVSDMIEWTKQPSLLPKINFGKHKGSAWDKVPDDYLDWLLRQKDMDEDVVFTARHHLKARAF